MRTQIAVIAAVIGLLPNDTPAQSSPAASLSRLSCLERTQRLVQPGVRISATRTDSTVVEGYLEHISLTSSTLTVAPISPSSAMVTLRAQDVMKITYKGRGRLNPLYMIIGACAGACVGAFVGARVESVQDDDPWDPDHSEQSETRKWLLLGAGSGVIAGVLVSTMTQQPRTITCP